MLAPKYECSEYDFKWIHVVTLEPALEFSAFN